MQRRGFLRAILAGAALLFPGLRGIAQRAGPAYRFDHGVASGDPLHDGVMLWTRVSGAAGESVPVRWQVAADRDMRDLVLEGRVWTSADRDYTVKADVRGLAAGVRYFYRFLVDGAVSPIGATRTLPVGPVDDCRFAVVSCSNYPAGYFNVYRAIADSDDLDAVIHLGDYIYEYGMGEYATEHAEALGRVPDPRHETVTLDDYRRRHAQYKADPDSQAMHRSAPLIAVWDDHEIANDARRDGAQNHQDGEGRWSDRCDAAAQAWYEWMPVRGTPRGRDSRIYRRFRYGDLLTLVMLDTRLVGRDRQPDVGAAVTPESIADAMRDPQRRMLGADQESWLRGVLQDDAAATWQVIGQQVMLAPVRSPELGPIIDRDRPAMLSREQLDHYIAQSEGNPPMLLDTWNGYPRARADLLRDLASLAKNPVILSGDLHTAMANDVPSPDGEGVAAVEIMTPSVSSPGFAEYLPEVRPGALRDGTLEVNPFVRFMETDHRGWVDLRVTPEQCTARWHVIDTVRHRRFESRIARTMAVRRGQVGGGLLDA